jgi:Domain of unknown function (DUF4168)
VPAVLLSLPDQKTRKEKSMAKTSSNAQRQQSDPQAEAVPDQVVSQVGKAVAQIVKLRQSLEENMATADSEEERQDLAGQIENAAVRAISDQGLTVDQYNRVIAATQADAEPEERVMTAYRTAA